MLRQELLIPTASRNLFINSLDGPLCQVSSRQSLFAIILIRAVCLLDLLRSAQHPITTSSPEVRLDSCQPNIHFPMQVRAGSVGKHAFVGLGDCNQKTHLSGPVALCAGERCRDRAGERQPVSDHRRKRQYGGLRH